MNAFEHEAQQLAGQCGLELKKRGLLAETADAQAVAAVLVKWHSQAAEHGFRAAWEEAVNLTRTVRRKAPSRRARAGGGS